MIDMVTFIYVPNMPVLGAIPLSVDAQGVSEYATLRQYLWDMGGMIISATAPMYGVPARIVPVLTKATVNGILGWGAIPAWIDFISAAPFTFNFVAGAAGFKSVSGKFPTAFVETQTSSAYQWEGLGYVTQHFETFLGPTTSTHACAWDPDCPADCTIEGSANCKPIKAEGFDAGKIPGIYFGSPKGKAGVPEFAAFVAPYYLQLTAKSVGQTVIPVKYKGPTSAAYDFEGEFVHATYLPSTWYRRIENCAGAKDLGDGVTDSPGIDCNYVQDTSPLKPYFGLPLYWMMIRDSEKVPGWDPAITNKDDGEKSIKWTKQATIVPCEGNKFCADALINSKGAGFLSPLKYGYEPLMGALVDLHLAAGFGWKFTPSPRHMFLMADGFQHIPLFYMWAALHLPTAVNMDLAKLQGIPAVMQGLYALFLSQAMNSMLGGIACCLCGV